MSEPFDYVAHEFSKLTPRPGTSGVYMMQVWTQTDDGVFLAETRCLRVSPEAVAAIREILRADRVANG